AGACLSFETGRVDVLTRDQSGNVLRDTKRERIARRNQFAQSASAFITNPAASSMLRSYAAAVADPRNELVHLYEGGEALCGAFGKGGCGKGRTWVRSPKRGTVGRLGERRALLGGRHRGWHIGKLRSATPEELAAARSIATEMIECYLSYLTARR